MCKLQKLPDPLVDQRSTIGIYTFLGGNLIIWVSKKQIVVSRSIIEADLGALAQGVMEGTWVKTNLGRL